MLITAKRYSEEYTRLISAILLDVIDNSRQGDVSLAESIGLDLKAINALYKLKPEQLHTLASSYIKSKVSNKFFDIDSTKMTNIIAAAATESEMIEIVDQYIMHGASKKMIGELFGMRACQVALRKRILGVESMKGRRRDISNKEKSQIYDVFVTTFNLSDERLRYLHVAKETKQSLHNVYVTIKEIEEIESQLNQQSRIYA